MTCKVGVICTDAVSAYLASSKNSAIDKLHARCLATGGYWTRQRLCRAGYDLSPLCPKCGAVPGTVHHRLWKCMDPEVVQTREHHISRAFYQGWGGIA